MNTLLGLLRNQCDTDSYFVGCNPTLPLLPNSGLWLMEDLPRLNLDQ